MSIENIKTRIKKDAKQILIAGLIISALCGTAIINASSNSSSGENKPVPTMSKQELEKIIILGAVPPAF